ncbi:hypothetical protein WGT02_14830 [Rhizobium sp. T1470]|uniref:hypothetical protein n=1 Tax=unclassified Rhizobium TaxID=2613769 RepID=UPI001AAEC0BA|nr:hypothetical protein [Rhizobium sp. T1473]MCA0802480.1 hypothetical protein [Rhizobium sp. T1473]
MAYGDVVSGCSVFFREWLPHWVNLQRRKSVTVEHVGRNRVLIHLPKKGVAVRKSLTAKRIGIVTRDGRDLVAEWREVPGRD